MKKEMCSLGIVLVLAGAVQADVVTVDAAAGATVTDEQRTGTIDLGVNTGTGSTGTVILNGANDYEGTTTLGGGTLEATVLAPAGTASSLGTSGAFTFQGGTFHYSGTEAATFDRTVTFGTAACTVANDADLTLSGMWTRAAKSGTFTKTGAGTLTFSADGNTFNVFYVNVGTLALTGGLSMNSKFYVNGPLNKGETEKSTLRIASGTHSFANLYVGQNSDSEISQSDEYWTDFIMTDGTVTAEQISLGNKGKAHVTMDVSGGTLTDAGTFNAAYNSSSDYDKYYGVTIRDTAVVSASVFYTSRYKKTHTTLTVKDGGTLKVGAIYRFTSTDSSYLSPTVFLDQGNIIWSGTYEDVFSGTKGTLESPILIGSKGCSFTGNSATNAYLYKTSLVATNTVAGMTAKGISFATGVYTLAVANTYDGPTAIRGEATVIPAVADALPSASVVKVNTYGTLALTNVSPTCAGLVLNGNLDIVEGQTLALGTNGVSGTGCITLYADADRTTPVASGSHAVLTAPIANRAELESFAQTVRNGNIGSFTVTDDGTTATLNLVVDATSTGTPDCTVEGTDASSVTISCVGAVEAYNGTKYVKPGTTAKLSITYPADGPAFAGWRDGTTGEFFWGNDILVTPTTYTTYVAVFGPAWCWDATAKQVSNGTWTLSATASGSKLTLAKVVAYPSTLSELNLATPITNAEGSVFTFARIGSSLTTKILFGADDTGEAAAAKVKTLYLGGQMTQIGKQAFHDCTKLTGAVTTPSTCRSIGEQVFYNCNALQKAFLRNVRTLGTASVANDEKLTTVYLSDNLTSVGEKAFSGDDLLATVTPLLPDTLEEIPRSAFYDCPVRGDLWLENVKRVCWAAFSGDQFDSVTMPSVTNVGQCAFYKSPATNYVFGVAKVGVVEEAGERGDGNQTFRPADGTGERHFSFPGKAPAFPVFWAGTHAASSNQLFGTSVQNGQVVLHGSWRTDPDGWQKIVDEIGGTDVTEKGTRPALRAGDRGVKGYFQWYDKNNAATCWGWLVNTKMPGEPMVSTGAIIVIR